MADVGDIIRAAVRYSSSGASDQLNVFWYLVEDEGIGNPALLNEIATFFTDVWAPIWATIAADTSQLVEVSVDIMNPDGTVKVNVGIEPIGVFGDDMQGVTPAANSGYLLAQTASPKSRGSKYLPGISEDAITDGEFSGVALVVLLSLAALYVLPLDTAIGATLAQGILSRGTATFIKFLMEASTTDVVAYQRRRKPNVGS